MLLSQAFPAYPILLFACFMPSYAFARMPVDTETLLKRIEVTYAGVKDYQADIEDRT